MYEVRKKIEHALGNALQALDLPFEKVTLVVPDTLSHGAYTFTGVMKAFADDTQGKKRAGDLPISRGQARWPTPHAIALAIVEEIQKQKETRPLSEIEKMEIAGPGFINFYLSREYIAEVMEEVLEKKEKFGKNQDLSLEKVMVEYTDANPFKELHIGHLMSNTIGESLSRIIAANGAEVKRACYQGDVGMHVAKTLYALIQEGVSPTKIEKDPLQKQVAELGSAYAKGANAFELDLSAKKEIIALNKHIYERDDETINSLYDWGKKVSLAAFEELYKKLGTAFDFNFFESQTGEFGKKIVEDNLPRGVFEQSDGAVVFKGENHGLHTRVFINSHGLPTYEAKELGLAQIKFENYDYTRSIIITANEVNDYFKVLLVVMGMIFPDLAAKTVHLSHGVMKLPTGKMASRKGNVITAEKLLSDLEEKVQERMKGRPLSDEQKKESAEKVAIGAVKFTILKQAIGRDIIFNPEAALSFEGDSGPYLQYSSVRAHSILEKAHEQKIGPRFDRASKVVDLENIMIRFPDVVMRSYKEFAPQYIVSYLLVLAAAFNSYYAEHQIVSEDKGSAHRVALTEAFLIVLTNGLELLGIPSPLKM